MPESIGSLERVLLLKKLPIFDRLPNEPLTALAQSARERTFREGELLSREGEPTASIHVLLDGSVRVRRQGKDLGLVTPGTPLGSLGILARDPHGFVATAERETFSLEIDADAFLEVCEDHFVVVHEALRFLSLWVIALEKKFSPDLQGVLLPKASPTIPVPKRQFDLVERILFLRRVTVFGQASINALAELSRGLTEVRFEPGVELWKEGDGAPYALMVVDGYLTGQSRNHGFRARLGPGRMLGAMDAMAEVPRFFDAVTETHVVALHCAIEQLIDVLEDNFGMAMDYVARLASVIMDFMQRSGVAGEVSATGDSVAAGYAIAAMAEMRNERRPAGQDQLA